MRRRGMPRQMRATLEGREVDAIGAAGQQRARLFLRSLQWQLSQVLAIESQDVEGLELDFIIVLSAVQALKVGDAIYAEQDGLAMDHKLRRLNSARGFG